MTSMRKCTRRGQTPPRVIKSVDVPSRVIRCAREAPGAAIFAISHRWEGREQMQAETWAVVCDEDEPYSCLLTSAEACHIQLYLGHERCDGVWLDYACINQESGADKNAQISIMGQIYLLCTTVIVGSGLSPTMPPPDYLRRAWCIQERSFGRMYIPWDMSQCDGERLKSFALGIIWTIPHMVSIKINEEYDSTENWRMDQLEKATKRYPDAKDIILAIRDSMLHKGNQIERAKLALELRQAINCDHEVGTEWPGKWEGQMFSTECQYPQDRLYGVYGVPVYRKGYCLPYENLRHAMRLVQLCYPNSNCAMYHTARGEVHGEKQWQSRELMMQRGFYDTDVVLHGVLTQNPIQEAPIQDARYLRYNFHKSIVVAIGEFTVGVGWEEGTARDMKDVPMYLVINKNLLQQKECHDAVKETLFAISKQPGGIPDHWKNPYDLWDFIKRSVL